jgi:hypothetical protein
MQNRFSSNIDTTCDRASRYLYRCTFKLLSTLAGGRRTYNRRYEQNSITALHCKQTLEASFRTIYISLHATQL